MFPHGGGRADLFSRSVASTGSIGDAGACPLRRRSNIVVPVEGGREMRRLVIVLVAALPAWTVGEQPNPPRPDAYGDPLPDGALLRIGTTRLRPGGTVTAMAFTPDGRKLITATHPAHVHIWDVATGREVHFFRPDLPRSLLALSPDGSHVALFHDRGACDVYHVASGDQVFVSKCDASAPG